MGWPGEAFDLVELARAEYGLAEEDIDGTIELPMLARSYVRRKQFEAKLIAGAVGEMFFGTPGKKKKNAQKVSPADALRLIGNPTAMPD